MRSNKLSERDQWISIKRNITSFAVDEYWQQASELFRTRIYNKFLTPIDNIIMMKTSSGEGFAIVALQCSLIETFASFKFGKVFNPRYNEHNDPGYQYKDSRKIFVDFLHEVQIFEDHFFVTENGQKIIDKPFSADDFYSNVRCALVHEGRTRKKWTINLRPKKESTELFIKEVRGKFRIYRTFMHKALKAYVDHYLDELCRQENELGRKYFGRKMDHIFELKKSNLNWWED